LSQALLPGVSAHIEVDRDTWTTPEWVWRIPLTAMEATRYDLDPCSNEHATVPARWTVAPPRDGLAAQWGGLVWMNPPYSDVGPWFEAATEAAKAGAIVFGVVPHAPSIAAWKEFGPDMAWSLGRVAFCPPPGVKPSSPAQEHDLVLWASDYRGKNVRHKRIRYRLERLQ
jgi:hypothetical protein